MILSEKIKIKAFNNLKYYQSINYNIERGNIEFEVYVKDLPKNSNYYIDCQCDICGKKTNITLYHYNKNYDKYNLFTCKLCASLKIKQTNLEKYGVEFPTQSNNVKEKIKQTNLEKYGVGFPTQSNNVKEKIKQTNLEKYGFTNPLFSKEIKEKIKQTNLEKYGVTYVQKNNLIRIKRIETRKKMYIKQIIKKISNDYIFNNFSENVFDIKHLVCNKSFFIYKQNIYDRLYNNICLCTECYPISDNKSIKEKEIINWIKSLNVDFSESDKTILNPKHLDVFIPSHNLAIEFNGLYWHSEFNKDKNYHLDKSIKCQEKGIQLLHIWEDEWIFKQEIVKSIILNKLSKIENRIYARECDIRVIEDSKLVRQFLDKNHIQGYSQSSIKLGLYYKNELVSLMTFGYRHTNAKKEFELIRFCNRINLNVIGAASKLFNYFKQNYEFIELVSYSDFRLFDGKMYQTLGFTKQHLSKPDYFWCKNLERKHRFNFNKQKLIKEGFDGSKTEVEIMHERGYFRIFGCGQYRWIYMK
jgi:hypothetical protein